MPTYTYTDTVPRVLHGLAHGRSVTVTRDGEKLTAQGTVEAHPGDVITTRKPYDHPFLVASDSTPDDTGTKE